MFRYKVDEEISLKLLAYEDAKEIFALADRSREHLQPWLPWINFTSSVEDSRQFIAGALKRYADEDGLAVCILFNGAIAGVIELHEIDWGNKRTSIGYWMGADYKGRGILTRSCRSLFDYVFNHLSLNRIEIRAAYENKKSRAVPERLGFVQEGIIREAALLYDKPVDHVVYGMLAKDWSL